MPSPTFESLAGAALAHLATLSAKDLYAIATEKRVPFYPEDDLDRPRLVGDLFRSPAALKKALAAGDVVAKRSALFLVTSADASRAWPFVRPLFAGRGPRKSDGYDVVARMAPALVGTIPNIPDDELLPLLDNPRVDPNAIVAGVLYHRRAPEERLRLLALLLAEKRTEGTARLAVALVEELWRRQRPALARALEGSLHTSWRAIAKRTLASLEEPADDRAPQKNPARAGAEPRSSRSAGPAPKGRRGSSSTAPAATRPRATATRSEARDGDTLVLVPVRWGAIEARYFSAKARRTGAGRDEAASILDAIARIPAANRTAWKRTEPFVGFVTKTADAAGDEVARAAARLARAFRIG